MVTLDSATLRLPSAIVRKKHFSGVVDIKEKNGEVIKRVEAMNYDLLGLKRVEIDYLDEIVKIELSAKILHKNYFKLISIDTIEEVFERLNDYEILEFKIPEAIENAKVLKCDFTKNVKVREPVNRYTRDIGIVVERVNKKRWNIEEHKNYESVVFIEKKKRNGIRTIFYDKQAEMLKDKNAKELGIENFDHVLRFEINAKNFETIRELTQVDEKRGEMIALLSVLNSQARPHLMVFEKLINGQVYMFYDMIDNIGKDKIRKYTESIGAVKLFKTLNDYENILIEKGYSRAGAYKVIRDLKKSMKFDMKTNDRIQEVYECLKIA
jgi:hypothetical protein